MISPKRNKNMKLNKVEKHNFKNAIKLGINKSINESNNIIYDHSPINKREKRRTSQITSVLDYAKKNEKNSTIKNNNPMKTFKKLHSTNKIYMIRFKDLILKQKQMLKKEEHKNETNNNLPIVLKLDRKNTEEKKKFISSNSIAHLFKNYSKEMFKNFKRKKSKNINDNDENTNYDINNIVKVKIKKKESKENIDNKEIMEYKHNKNKKEHKDKKEHINKKDILENKCKKEVKEEEKKNKLNEHNNEDEKEKEKEKKLKNVKCKFFCCL